MGSGRGALWAVAKTGSVDVAFQDHVILNKSAMAHGGDVDVDSSPHGFALTLDGKSIDPSTWTGEFELLKLQIAGPGR
jgi:hypothetical protein